MLAVQHSPPRIEPDPRHGWQITFWVGDACDWSTPFREFIVEVVGILEESAPVSLDLPAYFPNEDFVEGTLTFGEATLRVYYEYSLGYLALMSLHRGPLEDVAARLLPSVHVA